MLTLFPPNTRPIVTYHTATFRCNEGDGGMCPTSNHPGGVNVSFMDGSVHFIKNSIGLQPWWFMGTRGTGRNCFFGQLLRPGEPVGWVGWGADLRFSRQSRPDEPSFREEFPTMFPGRSTIVLTVAAAVVFALPVLVGGCGSVPDEFDNAANYTPETLANELILRYRGAHTQCADRYPLGPEGKQPARSSQPARNRSPERPRKPALPTIDDLLDDIESKLTSDQGDIARRDDQEDG